MSVTSVDLSADLRERWLPSETQRAQAEAVLRTLPEGGDGTVYTGHLLLHKDHGFWNADVVVVPLDGVFTDRSVVLEYLCDAAKRHHERTGHKVSGGYAHHFLHEGNEEAAVFEDILAQFPEPEYRIKAREAKEAEHGGGHSVS